MDLFNRELIEILKRNNAHLNDELCRISDRYDTLQCTLQFEKDKSLLAHKVETQERLNNLFAEIMKIRATK